MRRPRTLLVAVAGAALSLLLGSGLLALVSDSVTSEGNEFASGTFAGTPTAHDVKAALISTGLANQCDAMTALQDGPLTAAITGGLLDLSTGVINQTGDFCIRNDGTQPGRLRVTLANVVDSEVGDCETSEASAGDTSCITGAIGELGEVAVASFLKASGPHTSTSCASSPSISFAMPASSIVDGDLAPGETCRLFMRIQPMSTASETQKLLAQTDRLQFDIVFTLEDITAP